MTLRHELEWIDGDVLARLVAFRIIFVPLPLSHERVKLFLMDVEIFSYKNCLDEVLNSSSLLSWNNNCVPCIEFFFRIAEWNCDQLML